MAAPRRKATPVSVKATPSGPPFPVASLRECPETGSITMVRPNAKMSKDDMFLMKLTQIVMMSIGFLSIWGGVFEVAFDEKPPTKFPGALCRRLGIVCCLDCVD